MSVRTLHVHIRDVLGLSPKPETRSPKPFLGQPDKPETRNLGARPDPKTEVEISGQPKTQIDIFGPGRILKISKFTYKNEI